MELSTWLLFIAVALIPILSPGPAMLLAISNSLRFGLSQSLLSTAGNITGLFILSSAAAFGLGAILKTSTTLFLILKVIGAMYLIYLGVRQWRSKASLFTDPQDNENREKRYSTLFLEGFLVAITNPKAILFFTALFPQFINVHNPLTPQFLIMTFTFMGMSFSVLSAYALLANKAKRWFSAKHHSQWVNRIIGSIFMGLGVIMLQLKIERS